MPLNSDSNGWCISLKKMSFLGFFDWSIKMSFSHNLGQWQEIPKTLKSTSIKWIIILFLSEEIKKHLF